MSEPNYSISVFDDHAIIRGSLTSDILILLVELCKNEGFTHITNISDGTQGFKLINLRKRSNE